ncbi:YbfB/YjiJ family MFS transporter [Viridibacillus sp. YIM B01967]|uniref:YbfB/YjiJ family MFS transporter n=1 Tax=Viridibacillus soli TaxID=2798301 RepID=A0ABS1H490_9BACL|nr:YbfB/YjiJ family MFS transporter [Viridibacillus soli]
MNRQHAGMIIGGILFLVVAMGISRFALTPILPFMREDTGLSVETAGMLASANYVGYFIGALWAGFISQHPKAILGWCALINVLSIFGMGLLDGLWVWLVLRLIAGITGGLMFVLTSSMLMDYLAGYLLTKWSGYIFSGIGLGIALSGIFVPVLASSFSWQEAWVGLGVLSVLCVLTTLFLWRKLTPYEQDKKAFVSEKIWKGFMPWIAIAYALEGLGYIVTGTFLVDIIHEIHDLRDYAAYSWVVVGIGAIPSAPVWIMLMSKYSPVRMISAAYVLQVIGIVLPIVSPSIFGVMASAFLFGMTFVGIVTMTTSYARQLFPTKSASVVSSLTTVYALGQIVGPLIAGKLASYYKSYDVALLFAGGVVAFALILMLFGKWKTTEREDAESYVAVKNIAK